MQVAPPTSYTQRAESIAYQVFGEGPRVVMLPTAPLHLDLMWIDPGYTQVLWRLGTFTHTVIFEGVPGSWELFALGDGRNPTVPVAPEQPPLRPSDRVVLVAARRAPGLLRIAGRLARR
jgi:hypothetical protein